MTKKSLATVTKDLKRVAGPNGVDDVYYANATEQIKDKPKPIKTVAGDLDGDGLKDPKPEKTTYLEEYYNNIVTGAGRGIGQKRTARSDYGSRVTLVENLKQCLIWLVK